MSWIEKLYRTYENNRNHLADPNDSIPLLPLYHSMQNAQIHVVLNGNGNFLRATVIPKEDAQTIIPVTEDSVGRTGSELTPHPLCDTLQYVAGDYLNMGGNPNKKKNESGYIPYIKLLHGWANWSNDQKLLSVLTYLQKRCLIADLVSCGVLFAGANGKLAEKWTEESDAPAIFKAINLAKKKGQYEAFVRFSVEIPGNPQSNLWKDPELRNSWIQYYQTLPREQNTCIVTGKVMSIASNHPKNILYPGDGAKLISSNDTKGFTYLGRFTNDKEACVIGEDVTLKAHNVLRWLIAKQGYRDEKQAIVAWAVSGANIPMLLTDSLSLLLGEDTEEAQDDGYTAQEVGVQLAKRIAGYAASLGSTDEITVLGLDSATPGRMAITFYRELTGSELLDRIQAWHEGCCWLQRFGKNKVFVGAPAPRDIAEAAYGSRLDDKLRRTTVERLLPCIIDGSQIPRDLVESCIRRASSRQSIESWEWEKVLGIACALYRYYQKERSYSMALDRNRNTRDYLYGRLLALAEHLEGRALYVGGEDRETNAGRLMQRFSDRPYSTWLIIETALTPYKARLRAKRSGFLNKTSSEIDDVIASFKDDDFISDQRLTGEFLLGYHCQRAALRNETLHPSDKDTDDDTE